MEQSKYFERRVILIKETEKACLFKFESVGISHWIPKSLFTYKNTKENNMTGFITHTISLPKYVYHKLKGKVWE